MEMLNNSLGESAGTYAGDSTKQIKQFVSDYQRQMFTYVNNVILTGVVSILGSVANVINLIVFYKHGLNTTINISFFALAVADLCGLVMQTWYSICATPALDNAGLAMSFIDILYITAGVPREMFSRITCLITVYITAERCLCIAFPLKVKQIITSKATASTLFSIYVVTWITAMPLYCTSSIDWKFNPEKNATLLGFVIASNTDVAESAVFIIHAIFGVLAFFAVIVFTSILIRKLGQKSAWRKATANLNQEKSEAVSNRDRRTVAMIVLIACVLIICYTPAVLLCATTFYEPEFNTGGKYYNEYQILWSFAFMFEAINSSVNIFVYLKMSTKYRQTFKEMFSGCGLGDKCNAK